MAAVGSIFWERLKIQKEIKIAILLEILRSFFSVLFLCSEVSFDPENEITGLCYIAIWGS